MSLVNEMLRDLDRRRKGTGVSAEPRAPSPLAMAQDEGRFKVWLIGAIGVAGAVVGLAAAVWFLRGEVAEAPAVPVIAAAQQAAPQPQSAPPPAAPQPVGSPEVRVTSLSLESGARGYSVILAVTAPLEYHITSRTSYGLNLLLPQASFADDFIRSGLDGASGLSLYPVSDGLNLNFELPANADFQVYDRAAADGVQIFVEATMAAAQPESPALAASPGQGAPLPLMPAGNSSGTAPDLAAMSGLAADAGAAAGGATAAAPESALPGPEEQVASGAALTPEVRPVRDLSQIRTLREPGLDERDAAASQAAIRLAQRGQLLEAYDNLLQFLGDNPQGHKSREALVTLMMAQLDYYQAGEALRQGLALAPQHPPYKKLQARLLMAQGRNAEALQLLRQRPPELLQDREYHDLLASLYQRAGEHENAVLVYQSLLASDPAESRWWVALGISLEALERTGEAVASYRRSLQGRELSVEIRQYSQNRIRSLGRVQ